MTECWVHADNDRYYAGWSDKIVGELHRFAPSKHGYTIHEPLGVCAGVIPFNYPLGMLSWKLAPAIACGNVIIIKPAEQTPLSALVFASLVEKAGFPKGVIQILNGAGAVAGKGLAEHMDVDKIAFTGMSCSRLIITLAYIRRIHRHGPEDHGRCCEE